MMRIRVFHGLLCAALLLAVTGALHAQEFRATVKGQVVDSSKASLPGATVTVRNQETNEVATATTNNERQAFEALQRLDFCMEFGDGARGGCLVDDFVHHLFLLSIGRVLDVVDVLLRHVRQRRCSSQVRKGAALQLLFLA